MIPAVTLAGSGQVTLIHTGDIHGHMIPRANGRMTIPIGNAQVDRSAAPTRHPVHEDPGERFLRTLLIPSGRRAGAAIGPAASAPGLIGDEPQRKQP